MKKRFLLFFYFLGAIGLAHAQKTARIYLNGYGGGTSTGIVKVRVYNASYDSTFVLDVSNETTNRSYLSPPTGMYNISVENLSNGQVYHNICQMGNVCNSDYLRQNMCGYASDNTGIYDSQIGTNMGSIKVVYQNLNIVSKLNYQNKCITRFSDLDGDYELGAIYITLIVDERNVCRTMNYVRPIVTTNAQMVNDSTYQIASNSTLKLYGSCSSIITGYQAQWQSTGIDSLKEIITSNKVYQVRCKDNNACNTQYRKIYVNTYNGCSLTSNNSAVTGIVLNTNYSGPFVFEIVAPPPVGTITGSYEISDANGIWITGTFNQLRYDSGIGAYHIETNSYVAGSVANPESRNGFIKVKINTQQTYKVNYQYTSFGAYMAGQDANQGYNTVKPQGLSVTYASCIDGKSKVYGNSEAKIQDNNSSYESSKMRIRQLYPTVGNDLTPSFLRKFVYGADYNDDIDGGVIWDLGLVTTGQTYTYRIVGTTGESTGDYSDISFTPTCPNPQISASKSLICYGESSTLTVNGCNGNICWETGQTTATITVKPTFTSTYKAACTTTDGDYSSATFMVKVLNNNAVVGIISNKPSNTILPNENIMLTVSGCNNGQVIWVNGFTGSTQIVNPSRITDYFAYCDIGGCRSSISTIKVNVVPPIPTIISNNSEFCETTATNVILTASGCNGSYYWSTGETSEIIQVPAKTNSYWAVCRIDGIDSEKKYIKLKY